MTVVLGTAGAGAFDVVVFISLAVLAFLLEARDASVGMAALLAIPPEAVL